MRIKSYISTADLNDCHYPQKAQSQVIKSYCIDRKINFTLPITEQLKFDGVIREQVLNEKLDHLICFSVEQLGNLCLNDLELIKENVKKGMVIHFALESIEISDADELEELQLKLRLHRKNEEKKNLIKSMSSYRGQEVNFITKNHLNFKRDYQARANESKPDKAKVAKRFSYEYWDGSRDYGYGGYRDDGRWKEVAEKMIDYYNLKGHVRILDVGCGKGYLLKELKRMLPEAEVYGFDISEYAIENSAKEIRKNLFKGSAVDLPFEDNYFDFVLSNMTLHNLYLDELVIALKEMNRVSRNCLWLGVESYRNEEEKWNLMRWQLTCECFFTPKEWHYIFHQAGYTGDYEFIYFN